MRCVHEPAAFSPQGTGCVLTCFVPQVCSVYDSAYFCSIAHAEPGWRLAAQQACATLAGKSTLPQRCRYSGTVCNDRTDYRYTELSSLQKLQAVLVSLCESVAAKSTWQIVLTCSPDWRAGNFACRTTRLYGMLLLLEVSAAEAY